MVIARRLRQLGTTLQLCVCLLLPIACREASADTALSVTDLARVLHGVRLVEPRFSGGFDYAPCISYEEKDRLIPTAECSSYPEQSTWTAEALHDLGRRLEEQAESNRNPRAVHANAVYSALFGATRPTNEAKEGFLHSAITDLDRLRKANPNNPLLLNDLAATYYLQAVARNEPADLVQALGLIEQAYILAPKRPEIRFNRALVLDRSNLVFLAKDAWEEMEKGKAESGWLEEARSNLVILNQPSIPEQWAAALPELERAALAANQRKVREVVEIDRQRAREYAMEDKLGAWGDKYLAGDHEGAARELTIARAVGETLVDVGGDRTVAEAAGAVSGAREATRRELLARGHQEFRTAKRSFLAWQNGRLAREHFSVAADKFRAAASPMELWADEGKARALSYESRYQAAIELHRAVLDRSARQNASLQGWAYWGWSWATSRWKGSALALVEMEKAHSSYLLAKEVENAAAMRSLAGDARYRLGQVRDATRHWWRALRALRRYGGSLRRHNTFILWAESLQQSGQTHAALALAQEDLANANSRQDLTQQSEAHRRLGELLAATGNVSGALSELGLADAAANGVSKDGSGRKLEADVEAARGQALREGQPSLALHHLSRAIEFYARDGGGKPEEAENRTERARVLSEMGRLQEAEADLEEALKILETRKGRIGSFDQRATFEEASQSAYDAAIDIAWNSRRAPGRALAYLEQARRGGPTPPLNASTAALEEGDLGGIANNLPPDLFVVEYAVLPRELLLWTFHRGLSLSLTRPIDSDRLADLVGDFMAQVKSGSRRSELRSSALSAILLPEEIWTEGDDSLLILIPDKFLNRIPFAALSHAQSGRYLVEQRPLQIVPCLSDLLLNSSAATPQAARSNTRALLIGNPKIDSSLFPDLDNLPAAELETQAAASLFTKPTLYLGTHATRSNFLRDLPSADLVIFAGHSIANSEHPGQSYLVLAPSLDEPRNGLLFAEEIAHLNLRGLQIVILSSCSSAGPRDARVSGLSGLARPFLDAGARSVLGTLWSVRDPSQARLLARLIERLREGLTLPMALRSTQVEWIRARSARQFLASNWSGLEVLAKFKPSSLRVSLR